MAAACSSWWHCLCAIVDPMCPLRRGVCPSFIQELMGVLPTSRRQDSHAAFVKTLRRLLNSAELCLHFKIPSFSRPQISKSVAMLTSLLILKINTF